MTNQITKKNINCNNCGSESLKLHTKTKCSWSNLDLNIVICTNCNLVFSHPKPNKSLGLKYFDDAYSNAPGFENHSYYRDHKNIFIRNKNRFELVKRSNPPNSNILDFGSGQGHFLKVCGDNNWNAVGIELSRAAIDVGKKLFNVNILDSTENLPKNHFGVITLWDVIEHLQNPKETLLMLETFLHEDGILIFETSNIDSYDYLIKKRKWSYWDVDHYYYYSHRTLSYLLNSLGFEIINVTIEDKKGRSSFKQKVSRIIRIFLDVKEYWRKSKYVYYLISKKGYSKNSLMTVVAKKTNTNTV